MDHPEGVGLRLCCTNGVRDSLFVSSVVAGGHEQLVEICPKVGDGHDQAAV